MSRDILRIDILHRDQAVLDELQGRWAQAYQVDYADFEIPATSRLEAEGIVSSIRALIHERQWPGEWTVVIEEADKRVFLVGGQRHVYYALVTAPWKPRDSGLPLEDDPRCDGATP